MISCIIRTLNESDFIGRLIETLRAQKNVGNNLEIIVVDSGSTDATTEIAKAHKAELIRIKKEEFNYSYALNLGIEHSKGDIIAILSGHAIPCEDTWFEKMVSRFEDDNVAGVYCRQMPWPQADLCEAVRIEEMFGENRLDFTKGNSTDGMNFSNAASCIRKSIWKKHPFVIVPAAEDREWALWAIENGYRIVYEPTVRVYHSHNDSCRKTARRTIDLEKTRDFHLSRTRNSFLTVKQALGWYIRTLKLIFSQKRFKGKRAAYCFRALAQAWWYAADFNSKKL